MHTPLKTLVTGSSGFTGKYLVKRLLELGHVPIPLKANLMNLGALKTEIAQASPDYVIHLAGISFVASKDEEAFYRVHALGTGNLLSALAHSRTPPKHTILASSATVYGNPGTPFSTESQSLAPIDHYAMSKVAMEEMAKTYFDRLSISIARPFNYTGPGQNSNFLIPKLIKHFSERSKFIELGNLNVEREFNEVTSVCDFYIALMRFGLPGETYNICTGHARSLKQIILLLQKLSNHSLEVAVNPQLVRENEIKRMIGDPTKINELVFSNKISIEVPDIELTLKRMLDFQSRE